MEALECDWCEKKSREGGERLDVSERDEKKEGKKKGREGKT
jgi:hypothetical protein